VTASKPVVVLVRPQLGQNIGKAARAMLNFGLTELRLVAPRDGWPNPDAGPAASGADSVLEGAQVFATVAESIADCSHVFASTVRRRDLVMSVIHPEEMADRIVGSHSRSASRSTATSSPAQSVMRRASATSIRPRSID
jgi:tRNA/rRNA methyltransferase